MKAIVDQDKIIRITEKGDTEIGQIPKGVDLGRLRWDGSKVIDLATLSQIWVKHVNIYELHCVNVGGCQLVTMTYSERKNLTKDPDGTIRIKTHAELQSEADAEYNYSLKIALRKVLKNGIGDECDQLADLYKLVYLILLALDGDSIAKTYITEIRTALTGIYNIEDVKTKLLSIATMLAQQVPTYYASKI